MSRSRRRIRRRLPAPAQLAVDPQILKAHGEGHPGGGQGQGDQGPDGDLIGHGRDGTNAEPGRHDRGQEHDAEHHAAVEPALSRFIGWFHEFGIPVGGVVVNMVLDRQALGADVPEFVLNRLKMQDEHLETIAEKFDGSVRAVVPLFDQEVRGVPMLQRAAGALFA